MKKLWLVPLSLFILYSLNLYCQEPAIDKEKLLQMAQSGKLSGINSVDIRNLVKQAGITEEEMINYARERNVDFSQYLLEGKMMEAESIHVPITPPVSRKPIVTVPSFANRPDAKELKPFGYDIFQYSPTTFEPLTQAPTPIGYNIGPGDELIINIWGQTQLNYELTVSRDGYIVIPDVGKVQVEGQTIEKVRQRLLNRMSQVYEGLSNGKPSATTFLDVSLGKIRTIQVFVLGDIQVPGGYNLSGLATAFTAIYYAGGPGVDGSMRNVRIVHRDSTVDLIDLYDYILFGNHTMDIRLRDGDAVFIPPIGPRVAVTGLVNRPAIYELKHGYKLKDVIQMAGGLRYQAYDKRMHIERIVPFSQRGKYKNNILDLDVVFNNADEMKSSEYPLEDGDIVMVFSVNEERENLIYISGNVNKPGKYELMPGMTIRDLIIQADSLREDTFLPHATLFRTLPDLKREIISFDLGQALVNDTISNFSLRRLDSVVVYKEEFFKPKNMVSINGAVRKPGKYLRTEHMSVRDLIVLSGGVLEGTDLQSIEVSRIDTITRNRISQVFNISLPVNYWDLNYKDNFELMDFDHVSVRMKPEFSLLKTVVVSGEAMYPGTYSIEFEGERLSSLIGRFGGFKPTAYQSGIRFIRQIGEFGISRPSPEITETQQLDTIALKYNFVKKPRTASNEIPISIELILSDTTSLDNLVLQNGDSLIIPRDPGVVYVEGQVYIPSSVPYKKGASLDYYINQAGGYKRDAEKSSTVVVLPNGKKWDSGGFLRAADEILSGSTIITPLKIEEPSNTLEILREWVTVAVSTTTLAFIVWQVTR